MGSFFLFSAKREGNGNTFVRVGVAVVVIASVVVQCFGKLIDLEERQILSRHEGPHNLAQHKLI